VLDLQIHPCQRFVHVLHMFAGHLHQFSSVADDRPQCAYLCFRSKGGAQQTDRVQKLDPLAFMPVHASARHDLHMPRIHHTSHLFLSAVTASTPLSPQKVRRPPYPRIWAIKVLSLLLE
jgi:hypothetical protein